MNTMKFEVDRLLGEIPQEEFRKAIHLGPIICVIVLLRGGWVKFVE